MLPLRIFAQSAWPGLLGGLAVLVTTAQGQDWPRFRGPNGAGLRPALDLRGRWTERDIAWKITLPGIGHSSPVVWRGRLFVTCGDEATGKRTLLAVNAADGRRLWQFELAGEKHRKHADNSFASATPVLDAQ